ncbi:hypothetical protein Tco_0889165 [Tanacetum coccineum]
MPTKQWKPTDRLLPLGRQCPLVRSTALKSDYMPADPQETIAPVAYNLACINQPDPNCNWGSNVSQSMVMVPIHQDTSSVPLMTSLIIDLAVSQPDSTMVQASIPTSTATVTATTTTITFPPPPPQPQQGVLNLIITQRIGELERCIADLVEENQTLEERLDKQGNRMHKLET